jgi:hypothetical protein
MVAAKVRASLQTVAAQAFATNELPLCLALHRLLADETPLAIEAGMTAPRAERFPLIGDRCRKLRTAPRVAAHVA